MNPEKMLLTALAIGCALFVTACGGGSTAATSTTPSATVTNGTAATAAVTVTAVM